MMFIESGGEPLHLTLEWWLVSDPVSTVEVPTFHAVHGLPVVCFMPQPGVEA